MTYRMITAKPNIGLLCNGQVEKPGFPLLSFKLNKGSRVAVRLTKGVCDRVLGLEMKDINTEANIVEERIIFQHLRKRAVVVKEYVTWLKIISERALYHFLLQVSSILIVNESTHNDTRDTLCTIECFLSNNHATRCNDNLLIMGAFATKLCTNLL